MKTHLGTRLGGLFLSLILILTMLAPLTAIAAEADRPTLTIFDFTTELDGYLIEESPTIKALEDKLNVNLEFDVISGMNNEEQIALMIASGDYADILFRVDERMVDAGALFPMDDLLESHGPNVLSAWDESINKLRQPSDGQIYYIGSPKNRPEELTDGGPCFLIQYEVLDKLGYPEIKTLDDAYDALEKYLEIEPDLDGTSFIPWGVWADSWGYNQTINNPALWAYGFTDDSNAYVNQETYEVTDFSTTEYFKGYMAFLRRLVQGGMLTESAFITKQDEFNAQVANGRVLAMIYHTALISDSEAALRAAGMDSRCYARFPIVAEEGIVDRSQVYCESYDNGVGISVNCKNPELAMQVIDYIASLEGNILFNWGIEGEHYDVIDGKRVWKTDVLASWNRDPNYRYAQGINCFTWWPMYYGAMKLDDGDYATPVNKDDFYKNADEWTKKVLDAYDITCWGENFDTSGTPTPYGYAWTVPIEGGSDAELAATRADELRHTAIPGIVMAQTDEEFESNFATFVDRLYNESKTNVWEDALEEAIITRMELWDGEE